MTIPQAVLSGTKEEADLAMKIERDHPGLTPQEKE